MLDCISIDLMKHTKMANILWCTKCALLNFVRIIIVCLSRCNETAYLNLNDNNDNQPDVLEDKLVEDNHEICSYPATLPLMSRNNEKLKCRKVKAILRYHVPNQNKRPDEYAHHLLFMYYPFRNEEELRQGTYC